MSFQPTYNAATNRFATIPGTTPSYDADGNVLSDGSHTYAWDAYGNSITLDGVNLTFDALDRMVEQNRSGAYTQIVYAPTGGKLALMSGQSLTKAFIPLPGQATAVYTSSGLHHYRHSDWLGSARLTSSPSRTVLSTAAYAPFGETYSQSGTADLSFTGMNSDTTSGDYDFLFREYSTQGRWSSPDPAGLAAVDPSNPQSWNRYSYVLNSPLVFVDPTGLHWECVTHTIEGVSNTTCTWVDDGPGDGGGGGGFDSGFVTSPHHPAPLLDGPPDIGGGTSARIQCAAQFGRNHSLAVGVGAIFGDKVGNNFVTQLFLGNTVSSLAKIGTDIFGSTSPDPRQVVGMAIKGAGQGIPGLPRTFNPIVGPTRNAAVGAVVGGAYNVIAGVGQETLELGLTTAKVATTAAPLASTALQTAAAAVAWGKFILDAGTFAYGAAIACRP